MKRTMIFPALGLLMVMLVGCGGNVGNSAPTPIPTAPATTLPAAENWQFSLAPASSADTLTHEILAVLHITASEIVGIAHMDDSGNANPCYLLAQNIPLSGSVDAGGNISVTSASVAGQVLTFNGILASGGSSFSSGNYAFEGGCAAGRSGLLTGIKFKPVVGVYSGTLDPGGHNVAVSATLTQSPGATGFLQVNGTVAYSSTTCSKEFTIGDSRLAGRFIELNLTAKDGSTAFLYGNVDSLANQLELGDIDGTCGGGGYGTLIRE
jgi:hypothetical protein